jgi:hypothetical protein
MLVKLLIVLKFFFPFWALFIPVLLCPYDLHTTEERATVFLLVICVLMIVPLIGINPHYIAAFATVFYLRLLHSLTRLWRWRPAGRLAGPAIAVLLIAIVGGDGLGLTSFGDSYTQGFALRDRQQGSARDRIVHQLERLPGRQLVLVRYAPEHDPQVEWVYNRADIDASPIVWAREMSPRQDRPFLEYFHDRHVWLLDADQSPPKLSPYPLKEDAR